MPGRLFEVDTMPPFLDTTRIMQRADEVNAIQRMLADPAASAVVLIGEDGVGKSTLAALLYHRLAMAKEAQLPAPYHLVWLRIGAYTTFSDMLAALVSSLHASEPDFALFKPQQQISLLLRALRRTQENALVVLDQFEELLEPDAASVSVDSTHERELASFFFELLQTNIGNSRFLLTSREPLFEQRHNEEGAVRSYLVSRISTPEGTALLQRYGINGSPEELSMIWQRCGGHVFALIVFMALVHVSGIALANLLLSQEYQWLWTGDVMPQLIALLYQHLNPVQRHIVKTVSLFDEPVSADALLATMRKGSEALPMLNSEEQFVSRFERELQFLAQLSLFQLAPLPEQELRFSLHPLMRHYVLTHYLVSEMSSPQYANSAPLGVSNPLNQLRSNAESQEIALATGHTQVAAYYYTLMREQYPAREHRQGVEDVAPLIAAIRHLCQGYQWQAACDLLFAEELHECLPRWGAWRILARLYTALLPPSGMLTRRDEGLVACLLATLYGQLGEYQQSENYFDYALMVQREIGDTRGEAVTLANRGELCRIRSEHPQAQGYFQQAMTLNKQYEPPERYDIHLRSIVLHNMGLLYHSEKEYKVALNCYIHALRLTDKLQEQYDKGTILTNIGLLLYEQEKLLESLAVLLAALRLRQSIRDSGTSLLARFLFGVEQKMGTDAYAQLCREALETQEEVFSHIIRI